MQTYKKQKQKKRKANKNRENPSNLKSYFSLYKI